MDERIILKAGKRRQQTLHEDNMFDNQNSSIEITKRIQLNDDFDNLDQILKKYCNLDVPIQQVELKPVFEEVTHIFDDSCVTKMENDIKKNKTHDYEMGNYDKDFYTVKVSEIDYIEEYGLDNKEAQDNKVFRRQNNKKIHKNKF